MYAKIVSNTQVFLMHKDDGLPLVVDGLAGISSLKLVDALDEVAVTMLAVMLGAQVYQLILLALDVVDADLALLHQFLHGKITPQRDMVCARTVVWLPAMCSADVLWICSGTLPKLSPKPSSDIMLEQNTASFFIVRATTTSSPFIVSCAVSSCSSTLKIIGALATVTMYDDVDLPCPP